MNKVYFVVCCYEVWIISCATSIVWHNCVCDVLLRALLEKQSSHLTPQDLGQLCHMKPWCNYDRFRRVMGIGIHSLLLNNFMISWCMMTSSNGSIFRVTSPLCGNSPVTADFPSLRPVTQRFWYFLWCAPEQMVEQTILRLVETPSRSSWRHCNGNRPCGLTNNQWISPYPETNTRSTRHFEATIT